MSSSNSFFQSSPIKYSPKYKFKKKLKFNDCSNLAQENRKNLDFFKSTSNNDEDSFEYNTLDFDWGNIKSEIDIEEHALPTIKQELETDSNISSSPKHKKKKRKETCKNDGLHQNEIDGNSTDKVKEHQTSTFNEFKKPRIYSESDSQNEEHLNRKKEKKKRKKHKKITLNEDLGTETDSSSTSQKHKKKKHKEISSVEDCVLDSISNSKKKSKKDGQDNVNKKFNGSSLDQTKSNSNLDDQSRIDTNETKHDKQEKTITSETFQTDSSSIKVKKKKRQANEDNAGNKLKNKFFEDNIENPEVNLKKKKKKKKLKRKENHRNESISETNQSETDLDIDSSENNKTEPDEHLEKPKSKKKLSQEQQGENEDEEQNKDEGENEDEEQNKDEEQNDNLENKSMDQDQGSEIASKTSSINASNSDIEHENNSKHEKTNTINEDNFFDMNSSSDEISDNNNYNKPQKTQKTSRSPKNSLLDAFRKNPEQINGLKKKIEIISNEVLNKSVKKKKSSQSLFAQRFEEYSSNDECDSRFEPQVDHNTTLEDALERSKDNDTHQDFLEQCGNCITVNITFDVPKIHLIEETIALLTEKEKEKMRALGIKIKTGPFSKQEDKILVSNWKEFCKVHNVPEDPAPFMKLNFLKKIMSLQNRIRFGRFLARNLNDRTLHSVYRRFCTIMNANTKRRGRFTPEEDRIILEYLTKTDDKKPYRKLAKILNRDSALIHKRVVKLTNDSGDDRPITWSKEIFEEVVINLLKVTKIDDVHVFKTRPITLKEWKEVSKIMHIPPLKLKYAWDNRIYRELFYEYDEISTADIRRKLIDKLYEMDITDFRTIDWIELAKEFNGLSSANICKTFHTILRYHVPKNYHNKPKECLNYLKNELSSTYQFSDKKLKKMYLNI